MLLRLLKKIYQQLVLLVVVALVLAAAYVSIGRQFMPAIAGYNEFLEQQLFNSTGLSFSIDSLSGDFQGFNPIININGLDLLVGDNVGDEQTTTPLQFDRATIMVDVLQSIWRRTWVLEEFQVQRLELFVVQEASGSWRLGSMAASGNNTIDAAELYRALQRVSRLDLREVVINIENRLGDSFRFVNGLASIQNRGNNHFLHIDTTHDESGQELRFSFEASGSELATLDGTLHLDLPAANYSSVLRSVRIGDVTIEEFTGGGNFWLQWRNGQILQSVASLDIDAVQLRTAQGGDLTFEAVRGNARLRRQNAAQTSNSPDAQSAWSLSLNQMTLTSGDNYWRPFNLHASFEPGQLFSLRADTINLALLANTALASGALEDGARSQLLGYSPGGNLRNLNLNVPLSEAGTAPLTVRGNLDNVELGSVRGSPNMWGLDGYFEARFDRAAGLVSGSAALESDNFSINIPNVFTQVWDYDYVNGGLEFAVDLNNGQRITLQSSVIVAESDAVDGHVQFRSVINQPEQGEREALLDLIVGASRIDAAQKALYLPDGPGIASNLRNSMEYLNSAIIDGDIVDSAIVFRGNTVPGSGPATKSFQGFFNVENGELEFNSQWPRLENLSASVVINDNDIDIEAQGADSLQLSLTSTSGRIRRNERNENWLTISGEATGQTAAGLDYIQAAPLAENLKQAFADWRAEGPFSAAIEVMIPLSLPGTQPDIRLDMLLSDNALRIDNLDIDMSAVQGPVVFDTRTGLEPTQLSADFFGDTVDIYLSSEFVDERLATLLVDVQGSTTPETLIDWPRQSAFVRQLLSLSEGVFEYDARLSLDQTGEQEAATQLDIRTDFVGTTLNFPKPFTKSIEDAMAFQLGIDFMGGRQNISGALGEQLAFNLELNGSELQDGLVFVGADTDQFALLAENETEGLAVVGNVQEFELEQWIDFVTALGVAESGQSGSVETIAFVDVLADSFNLYGQTIPAVAMRIEPSSELDGWWARLMGESLQGEVVIPFETGNHLLIDLDHLRLPGSAEELDETLQEEVQSELLAETAQQGALGGETEEVEEVRIDPLVNLDPRELPPMRFSTDDFTIGEREFGSWQFTLNPTADGAEFDDLVFDFRGLRLGMDTVDASIENLPAHFSWTYDGAEHRSSLTGVLTAGDLGEVLLANGVAASLISSNAVFVSDISWPGSPAFFSGDHLSGRINMVIENGRFLQDSNAAGALKLVSIINFSAIMRRLRFSDDLLRRGLAFDEITGDLLLDDGEVEIQDRLVISGPSSLYQITGGVNLEEETIAGEMFVTLPVSDNIPWLGLLTANLPLAVGAYLFDQIFGDQVASLTSAVYTLQGPWEGLQPVFRQAFGSPQPAANANREAAPQGAATTPANATPAAPPGQ